MVLENGEAGWSLTVRDDGRGPGEGGAEGHGLRGLRERLAQLDGTLTVSDVGAGERLREPSGVQSGFAVRASVPRKGVPA
jgi:two-component system sensor histidine kinase DesK